MEPLGLMDLLDKQMVQLYILLLMLLRLLLFH